MDDKELALAKQILGTTKNTEVVRRAVHAVIASQARNEFLTFMDSGALDDLGDADVMSGAWS